jgi:hypothetical protein
MPYSTRPCLIAACCLLPYVAACSHAPSTAEHAKAADTATLAQASATAADAGEPIPFEGQVSETDRRVELISPLYTVDRIYKSMTGPWSNRELHLLDSGTPELVWITGCHVEMVEADGHTHMPEQFMCHVNIDFDGDWHNDLFRSAKPLDGRLFTLSQGQLHVHFPPGFGIPVMSSEILDVSTQVLNLNVRDRSFQVRHKVYIDVVRDRDAPRPMKPLYERAVMGMVSLEGRELVYDQHDEAENHDTGHHHSGHVHGDNAHSHTAHPACKSCCVPGAMASEGLISSDSLGRQFTTHWVVKPGREVNRTRATTMMALPFDTTLHYIAVHMHPFAESFELRDLTADRSLFKSNVQNLDGEIGLAHVDFFSSEEGIPAHKDHEYELVSVYNNTTDQDQDSMAVMYIYFLDQEYRGPDPTLSEIKPDEAASKAAAREE